MRKNRRILFKKKKHKNEKKGQFPINKKIQRKYPKIKIAI